MKNRTKKVSAFKWDQAFLNGKPGEPLVMFNTPRLKPSAKLRAKVKRMLYRFLESDNDCGQIWFDGEIVSYQVRKVYVNIKAYANGWDQYVMAVLDGWPDIVGKFVKSLQSHALKEGTVMRNELLSDGYSISDYVPRGYRKAKIR